LLQLSDSLNTRQGQNALEQPQPKQISDQELQNSRFQSNADQGTENLTLPSKGLLKTQKALLPRRDVLSRFPGRHRADAHHAWV